MKVTRRKFLAAAPAVAGAVFVTDRHLFAAPAPAVLESGDPLSKLGWASFLPYVGTSFSFRDDDDTEFTLRLDRMDDQRTAAQRTRSEECFSMMFSATARSPLEQGNYRVKHFGLGEFTLFVTEQDTIGGRKKFEAVVNRITA